MNKIKHHSISKRMLWFIALLLTTVQYVYADPITREQAQKKAEELLKKLPGSKKLSSISGKKLAPSRFHANEESAPYYVFNRGENEGFVIIAGDDAIESALGYTDSGTFDYEQIPDNMRYWLDDYAEYVKYLQSTPGAERRKIPTHPAISPMLTCTWNQGAPYNNECPMYFTLGRSITGCVATAMAQVMYHQRSKSVDEVQADIPGYTTWTSHPTYGQLAVEGIPAGSPIDWANMLDNYNGGGTAKQQLAVAQLMHYCGVSVEMDYTNSSSGAQSYKVSEALNKYFGYSKARYVSRNDYSDDNWDALIYNELEQGRVVYLSGANSEAGHAFVTDGYDGNKCYHINWGWGGQSDGFFLLSSLNPSSQGLGGSGDGYNQYQDAVIGCEPDNYSEKEMPIANSLAKKLCIENFDTNGDGKFTYGEAASVTDIGTVFMGQRISSFTEFYYFISLTTIADHAFDGCATLSNIKLPKNLKSIGAYAFNGCRALKTFKLPEHITSIGKGAFANCRVLPDLILPIGLTSIADSTFAGCQAFENIDLPIGIENIGTQAFEGCTKLTTFTVHSLSPQNISLGLDVFSNINLSKSTLNVAQGTKTYFSSAEQWRDFGNIYEERNLSGGNFTELVTNKLVYIFNEGTGKYLTKGEAYNTQAVVKDDDPMRFKLVHTSSMGEDIYYIYSDDTGNNNHILFRTTTDGNVGNGVKACFVDGPDSYKTNKAGWWCIKSVGNGVYTIQTPSNASGYISDQYLGIQTDHASNAASPTYGAYSDISYSDYQRNCQWRFVEYDENAIATYEAAKKLNELLSLAEKKGIDTSFEKEVYDDLGSTIEDISAAQRTLRKKLNFIIFKDEELRSVAITNWDLDGDGELSYSEASKVADFGYWSLYNHPFVDLSDLKYFTNCEYLYGNFFENCKTLKKITLPEKLTTIYYQVFKNCTGLKEITLPEHVTYLGANAFDGCKALQDVTVLNPDPSTISLGESLFANVNLKTATLHVPHGSKVLYENANVWKEFGKIEEVRGKTRPKFSPIEPNVSGYVYNLGEHKYINQGEAYGTQAIVSTTGLLYQFRRTNSMPEGVYYLYSDQAGGNHVLFRTSTDGKVGEGVKACFVDGNAGASAYWQTNMIGENIYTMQVPSTDATYTAGEYLGIQTSHASDAESPTYGLYWDIAEASGPCIQWGFITKADMDAAKAFDEKVEELKKLLDIAKSKELDVASEQTIYDNFDSSEEEISNAILSLRDKLHYIDFSDSRAKSLCVANWDTDDDGELSLEEAAAVKEIRTTFRLATSMKNFEELRYFTSLTELPDEAFYKDTSLKSIYIPENVKEIGDNAFYSCNGIKYMAILSKEKVDASGAHIPSGCTLFVPSELIEAYSNDETWGKSKIKEYTGIPIVTADNIERYYGRSNPTFTYEVTGAPINNDPTVKVEPVINPDTGEAYTDVTLPAGSYEIVISGEGITSPNLQLVNGTLTVEKSQLTITAKSYKRNVGEENPEFKITYKGFRNSEKAETALSVQPVIECDATPDSPAGEYEIRVSGGEAANYELIYVNGVLTIENPTGIESISIDEIIGNGVKIYDLQGRKVTNISRGIYIINGKKVIVK